MKRNVNVFIAVVLVAVLCGGVVWLRTADDEKLGWNIHDTYGDAPAYSGGAAYTNATFAGPTNDGGVMTVSPSRAMRHSAVSSYAGAHAVSYGVSPASSPNSLIASSPLTSAPSGAGLYTTSSKTFNSYGGGGNGGAAMGGAMRGSSSPNSLIASSPITSISSPIAYSTARRGEMSSAAGDNPVQMLAENPAMAMTNAASVGNGFYGFGSVVDYSASANNTQYSGMFGGNRSNVRGKQNANPWDSWLSWLYKNENGAWGTGTKDENGNWIYTYSEAQLRAAYEEWVKTYGQSWGPNPPSFEVWWEWMLAGGYDGYTYDGNTYRWVPVGDILPLLLIALLYMLFVAIKSKSLKSLLKTERSE